MASMYTPQEISEMKAFLEEHPIDHRWDDPPGMVLFDIPDEQVIARYFADELKGLGELPEEE